MKLFGLTGGIGMGKSTAAQVLRERGVPIMDTDELAREVVAPGQPALREIENTFGKQVISADGRLLRKELAKIVFADAVARGKLESITHPRIRELWRQHAARWRSEDRGAGVVVIPLLFETNAQTELDAVICVACSPATQMKRLAAREWSGEQIAQRLAAQWPVEKKMAQAQFVVWNEGAIEVLVAQLARIIPT